MLNLNLLSASLFELFATQVVDRHFFQTSNISHMRLLMILNDLIREAQGLDDLEHPFSWLTEGRLLAKTVAGRKFTEAELAYDEANVNRDLDVWSHLINPFLYTSLAQSTYNVASSVVEAVSLGSWSTAATLIGSGLLGIGAPMTLSSLIYKVLNKTSLTDEQKARIRPWLKAVGRVLLHTASGVMAKRNGADSSTHDWKLKQVNTIDERGMSVDIMDERGNVTEVTITHDGSDVVVTSSEPSVTEQLQAYFSAHYAKLSSVVSTTATKTAHSVLPIVAALGNPALPRETRLFSAGLLAVQMSQPLGVAAETLTLSSDSVSDTGATFTVLHNVTLGGHNHKPILDVHAIQATPSGMLMVHEASTPIDPPLPNFVETFITHVDNSGHAVSRLITGDTYDVDEQFLNGVRWVAPAFNSEGVVDGLRVSRAIDGTYPISRMLTVDLSGNVTNCLALPGRSSGGAHVSIPGGFVRLDQYVYADNKEVGQVIERVTGHGETTEAWSIHGPGRGRMEGLARGSGTSNVFSSYRISSIDLGFNVDTLNVVHINSQDGTVLWEGSLSNFPTVTSEIREVSLFDIRQGGVLLRFTTAEPFAGLSQSSTLVQVDGNKDVLASVVVHGLTPTRYDFPQQHIFSERSPTHISPDGSVHALFHADSMSGRHESGRCYVTKFTPTLDVDWSVSFAEPEGFRCSAITMGPRGNILVSGGNPKMDSREDAIALVRIPPNGEINDCELLCPVELEVERLDLRMVPVSGTSLEPVVLDPVQRCQTVTTEQQVYSTATRCSDTVENRPVDAWPSCEVPVTSNAGVTSGVEGVTSNSQVVTSADATSQGQGMTTAESDSPSSADTSTVKGGVTTQADAVGAVIPSDESGQSSKGALIASLVASLVALGGFSAGVTILVVLSRRGLGLRPGEMAGASVSTEASQQSMWRSKFPAMARLIPESSSDRRYVVLEGQPENSSDAESDYTIK